MSYLVKPQPTLIKDLDEPQLGAIIQDEMAVAISWLAGAAAVAVYIPVVGIFSAIPMLYMGYRDVKALTKKPKKETYANAVEPPVAAEEPEFTEPSPWVAKPRQQPKLPAQEVYTDPFDKAEALGVSTDQVLSDDRIVQWGQKAGTTLVESISRPKDSVFEEPPEHPPFDIAAYLAANPAPTMITAPPRTGKGIISAQLGRAWKQANPNGYLAILQPKYHPDEWGYWESFDAVWGDMVAQYQGNPTEIDRITAEWEKFIFDWRATPKSPKMLIIDEGVLISAIAKKWFNDFLVSTIKAESSSGETDNRFLIYITQSALVQDIGMSSGDRSCLNVVCLAKPDKKQHMKSFLRSYGGDISEPKKELFDASGSPKKAIAYCSALDEWHPLPSYPVYQASKPHPKNVAGKPKNDDQGYGSDFTEPNPWVNSESLGWDFDDEPQAPVIEYPEIQGKIEKLKQGIDQRYVCAGEFLEELLKQGDDKVLSPSEISKTAWAQRWTGKPGGLKDRSIPVLSPFIKNTIKFGFLVETDGKYQVRLK
ncbi:MAG: hypothetical protein AAGA46_00260 [Cyanobacteria bacterium P01_F01_bin.13]